MLHTEQWHAFSKAVHSLTAAGMLAGPWKDAPAEHLPPPSNSWMESSLGGALQPGMGGWRSAVSKLSAVGFEPNAHLRVVDLKSTPLTTWAN